MGKALRSLVTALLPLALNADEETELQRLAEDFVQSNIQEYLELAEASRTRGDRALPSKWRELRRKEGIRVYTQRDTIGNATATEPIIPSLLLFGTVVGSLQDVMYAVAGDTDEAMKVKSRFVQDGIADAKVLREVVKPSLEEPFRHVNVTWRLYKVPEARDYICVEASGIATTADGESIGYHVAHSVAFPQLPPFRNADVERGNLSVCALYRQTSPTSVESYVHGFFDFQQDDTVLSSISMNAMANQWLSFSQLIECAEMKKLVWRLRKKSLGLRGASGSLDTCSSNSSVESVEAARKGRVAFRSAKECSVCTKGFKLLGPGRKGCWVCDRATCSRCCVKKLVCTVKMGESTEILEKKCTVCSSCIRDIVRSDALVIARDELSSRGYVRDSAWWSMSE